MILSISCSRYLMTNLFTNLHILKILGFTRFFCFVLKLVKRDSFYDSKLAFDFSFIRLTLKTSIVSICPKCISKIAQFNLLHVGAEFRSFLYLANQRTVLT